MKAIIFDMDGLLIDSETTVWPKSISEFLLSKGISNSKEAIRKARGSGHRVTIGIFKKDLGLKGDDEELVSEMRSYFFKNFLQNPVLIDGVEEFLKMINEKEYLLAIATGSGPRNEVIELLSELRIKDYFEEIVTGDEITKGKPDPQIYLVTAKKLGINPVECLALEDAANGVLAGKAAGMRVFGVNKDEQARKELEDAGADEVFSSLLEIKDL
jgi:beta-phosphoglucomutase